LVYESEPGIRIPSLLLVPDVGEARKPAVIYVHGQGKKADASPGGDIERLTQSGMLVLAIDARGFGESNAVIPNPGSNSPRWFGDYQSAMTAFLIGRSLVEMRVLDIHRGIDLLVARTDVDGEKVYGFGKQTGAVPLLYAAVGDERIRKLALEGMLASYELVATRRIHRNVYESIIPGALKSYDLADLVAAIAPRPVWIANSVDPLGQIVPGGKRRRPEENPALAYDPRVVR
jgi:cephalosporin-C deacetylase-like acetyl esterase